MITILSQPWPWYVSGPAIALILAILLFSGKTFGFSANLSNICSMMGLGKRIDYFKFDWKKQRWNLLFLVGSVIGGYIAAHYLQSTSTTFYICCNDRRSEENEYSIRRKNGTRIHF